MSGLDDLLGSLTKGTGNQGGGGLEDLLGGLLGGGSAGGSGGTGGLQDILGGLRGGGSGGSPGTAAPGGLDLGALAAALGPLLGNLLQGGGSRTSSRTPTPAASARRPTPGSAPGRTSL
jgi:hypothetical protein